ncbi:MAG: hypothetical protein GX661_06505 [Acholeplasmataceae bacterium]|nr:hypothetical protein [Acholeplasmataceae bacterium]
MIKESLQKLNIDSNNQHLIDIYYPDAPYLELGCIDYHVLVRLLNYELIDFEDIAYFPIQNAGIGRGGVADEQLQKKLPFLFFERLNQKNKTAQLFITYGLLRHKNEKNNEIFSPAVLIPVNIYFENNRVFIQQISRPLENSILLTYISKTKNIDIVPTDKLDTAYAIDRYCLNLEKHLGLTLELENFLTYADLRESEIRLERNIFKGVKNFPDYLWNDLYSKDYPHLYYSEPLNRLQRYSVYMASKGNNLVITGRMGTGKTTALFNIAMNALKQGKRVLYLSNMRETLDDVYRRFKSKNLHNYVTNFADSFASFLQGDSGESFLPESAPADMEGLLQNYNFIRNYIELMTGRILDFRFIDLINELALLADQEKDLLQIDDLSNIYKAEYNEIEKALARIELNLLKIGNYRSSIWKEIPLINNIKYPNQVFSLIHQVQKNYQVFETERKLLEEQYGFKSINNYAYLKSVVHDFRGLNVSTFPYSWLDSATFLEAMDEYRDLKSKIYQIQEMEYLMNFRYENLEKIVIETEMKNLFGPYFTSADTEKLDLISQNRKQLEVLINKATIQTGVYKKTLNKVSNFLNWDFDQNNTILNKIIELNTIIHKIDYSPQFIKSVSENSCVQFKARGQEILDEVVRISQELSTLFADDDFAKKGTLENNVENLEKFVNEQPIKRNAYRLIANIKKEKPETFTGMTNNLKRFRDLKAQLATLEEEFLSLTGFECREKVMQDFDLFHQFFGSLPDKLIKSKFLKFLKNVVNLKSDEDKLRRNYYNTLDQFSKTIQQIRQYYRELQKYDFSEPKTEFNDLLDDLQVITTYLTNDFASNSRLMEVKKFHEYDYVPAEEYLSLSNYIRNIATGKAELKNNQRYQRLYGKLYAGYETNINNISRYLQAYKVYSECFQNQSSLIDSFNQHNYAEINAHLERCDQASNNLTEVFKLYFKVFKDSVSKYYYSSFAAILDTLERLMNAKDELIDYLNITENIRVLYNYDLTKLIDHILNVEDPKNLNLNFRYTYLQSVKELYLKKYPILSDYQALESCLEMVMASENKVIECLERETINAVKNESSSRSGIFGVKNLNYDVYVYKTQGYKHLFLTDTRILNNFLTIEPFDLVIIDDAHLLSANNYYQALQGKQVVVAGEQQLQSLVANNLVSRIGSQKSIVFNYRFLPTPQNLLIQMHGLKGIAYHKNGLEKLSGNIPEYLCRLLIADRKCVINLFMRNYLHQRNVYDELADMLLKQGFTGEEIISVFREKLNICDLELGYLFDADYNILVLQDYYQTESEYVVVNMIDNLLLCKRKLVVFDNRELLNSTYESRFINELRRIQNNEEIYHPVQGPEMLQNLVQKLEHAGLKVYSDSVYNFIIKKDDAVYAAIVFWDTSRTDYGVLDDYREYYINRKFVKTFVIWSLELSESVQKVADRIIEAINND